MKEKALFMQGFCFYIEDQNKERIGNICFADQKEERYDVPKEKRYRNECSSGKL